MSTKKIVSIQDISCYGQCSLTVALPILSAYGIETAILPSGILSTHTGGFKNFTFLDLTDEMPKILNHWISEGIRFDAIYTGYIGDARQFDLIRQAKEDILNPGGLLIVDPAMADYGKLYTALNEDIVLGMREIVREADLILPNLTEAAFLLDTRWKETYTKEEILQIAKQLADMGPKTVILTGVSYEPGHLGAIAWQKESEQYTEYFTEWIPKNYHGTGDVFSSVAIADVVNGKDIYTTLKDSCEFVVKSIRNTLPDESHGYGVKFETVLAESNL
ncbi:MAG: pyridoxamine kinase [Lachnospiraceae bacterium]|nr:pyridoxamine kinase [Lachnospiraceae bacterium]